jgi:hypothetical protein
MEGHINKNISIFRLNLTNNKNFRNKLSHKQNGHKEKRIHLIFFYNKLFQRTYKILILIKQRKVKFFKKLFLS